jgi:hypothetical protein
MYNNIGLNVWRGARLAWSRVCSRAVAVRVRAVFVRVNGYRYCHSFTRTKPNVPPTRLAGVLLTGRVVFCTRELPALAQSSHVQKWSTTIRKTPASEVDARQEYVRVNRIRSRDGSREQNQGFVRARKTRT